MKTAETRAHTEDQIKIVEVNPIGMNADVINVKPVSLL